MNILKCVIPGASRPWRSLLGTTGLVMLALAGAGHAGDFQSSVTRTIGPYTSGQTAGGPWTAVDDREVGAMLSGQGGWTSAASCDPDKIDQEVTVDAAHHGIQSVRLSNWYTSPCVDSLLSPSFAPVGETGSETSGGAAALTHETAFDFWFRSASTTPDPGMAFTIQLGALASYRLSFLKFVDSTNPDTCLSSACLHLKTIGIVSVNGSGPTDPAGDPDFVAHYSPALTRGAWYHVTVDASFNDGPLDDTIHTQVHDSAGNLVWDITNNSWEFGYYVGLFNGVYANDPNATRPVQGPYAAANVTFDVSASAGPGSASEYSIEAPHGIYFDDFRVAQGATTVYSTSFESSLYGGGDIALVVNGPVDPVHVGETAQFAATMLADPQVHQGETFAYKLVLAKSNGSPLALSDVGLMQVFYGGQWVDVASLYGGTLPFVPDGNGNYVYTFPYGLPGYNNGFPILDPSWTWNVRFSFTTTGTYSAAWTLLDGVSQAPVSPPVTGAASVVVQPPLPPTDMSLSLTGPVNNVATNERAYYTATLTADPQLHTGEQYFVRVTMGKAGGHHALASSDLAAFEVYFAGVWQSFPASSFQFDGNGNLVLDFPLDLGFSGFTIDDPQWTWHYRIAFADTGVYTTTADLIPSADVNAPSPTIHASDSVSTTVIPSSANLAVSITDGHQYVRYGDLLAYTVSVENPGATAMTGTLSVPVPNQVLAYHSGWT